MLCMYLKFHLQKSEKGFQTHFEMMYSNLIYFFTFPTSIDHLNLNLGIVEREMKKKEQCLGSRWIFYARGWSCELMYVAEKGLQQGDAFQGARVGSCLTLRNELFQKINVLTKQDTSLEVAPR